MHPKKKRFQYGVVLLNIHVYIYAYIFIYLKKFCAVGKHLSVDFQVIWFQFPYWFNAYACFSLFFPLSHVFVTVNTQIYATWAQTVLGLFVCYKSQHILLLLDDFYVNNYLAFYSGFHFHWGSNTPFPPSGRRDVTIYTYMYYIDIYFLRENSTPS